MVISGVHGVEGFCGSAIQTGMLLLRRRRRRCLARHGGAVRARGQSLRLFASASRHAGEHRPQPQLRRLLQAPAGQCRLCGDPRTAAAGAVAAAAEVEAALAAYRDRHGARGLQRAMGLGPARLRRRHVLRRPSGRPGATTPSAASCAPCAAGAPTGLDRHPHRPRRLRRRRAHLRQLRRRPGRARARQAVVGRTDLGHHRHLDQHSADRTDPDRAHRGVPAGAQHVGICLEYGT